MFSYIKRVFKGDNANDEEEFNSHYIQRDLFNILTPHEFVEIQKFTLDGIQLHSLVPEGAG